MGSTSFVSLKVFLQEASQVLQVTLCFHFGTSNAFLAEQAGEKAHPALVVAVFLVGDRASLIHGGNHQNPSRAYQKVRNGCGVVV